MNICFVSNFSKTHLYRRIADCLRAKMKDINIYWIFVDEGLVSTAGRDPYLLLDLSYVHKDQEPVGEYKIHEMVISDRVFRKNIAEGCRYLRNVQQPVFDFLSKREISLVFGERTWAHEMLIGRKCLLNTGLQCRYFSFGSVRIPDNRFGFFRDEVESCLEDFDNPVVIEDFIVRKPGYVVSIDGMIERASTLRGRLGRIKRFITKQNVTTSNPTVFTSLIQRLEFGVGEELNRASYRRVKTESFEQFKGTRYVFYGLHKQPESSIDNFGRYFEDQYLNILNIWKNLPIGWRLLIKEHTNAIGDRPASFYANVKRLPNVHVVHEKTNSIEIIRNALLTISVTGTISLEAGLMGKKAFTLSPVFFNLLSNVQRLSWEDLAKLQIAAHCAEDRPANIEEYKRYILKNTFEGNTSDPVSDPTVLKDENLALIAQAFMALFSKRT